MTLLARLQFPFLRLRRRGGLLSAAFAMALVVATAASGQAPSGVEAQATLPESGLADCEWSSRRRSATALDRE